MKRSYFAPDDFEITPDRLKWAVTTFNVSEDEVTRQTELWHEHEYKRAYSDWNRAWKRWFRQAEKYDELRREHKHRTPETLSEEQTEKERIKGEENLERLGQMALRAVK